MSVRKWGDLSYPAGPLRSVSAFYLMTSYFNDSPHHHLPSHCNIRRKNPSSGTYNSLALLPSMPGLSVSESYIPTTIN